MDRSLLSSPRRPVPRPPPVLRVRPLLLLLVLKDRPLPLLLVLKDKPQLRLLKVRGKAEETLSFFLVDLRSVEVVATPTQPRNRVKDRDRVKALRLEISSPPLKQAPGTKLVLVSARARVKQERLLKELAKVKPQRPEGLPRVKQRRQERPLRQDKPPPQLPVVLQLPQQLSQPRVPPSRVRVPLSNKRALRSRQEKQPPLSQQVKPQPLLQQVKQPPLSQPKQLRVRPMPARFRPPRRASNLARMPVSLSALTARRRTSEVT